MPPPVFAAAVSAPDAGADVTRQTSTTLARLDERLRAERSSLADAVAITVYLRNPSDFAAMNEAYRQAWTALPPTRTTVVTDLLDDDALVAMAAVAVAAGGQRSLVHPAAWASSPNPYSYGVRSGDLLFLSGLIARNGHDNRVVAGDVVVQTRTVLENARELMAAAGLSLAHIASARVFLTDLADFDAMNRVYREYFADAPPARATVGAALTGPAYKVEMTFVASVAPRRVVRTEGAANPDLSPAVVAGNTTFLSGLPAGTATAAGGDAAAQTRDIVERLDHLLARAGMPRSAVRELLVYVTDDEAARVAVSECRAAFGAVAAITPVRASLATDGARVEIMATAVQP